MPKKKGLNIVVGLGNPGKEFENTYHNVGQILLMLLSEADPASNSLKWKKEKYFEYLGIGEVVFIRPLTFMNESGRAVREALKKFDAKPADLTIIQDESDLPIGNFKISFARNSAGHKGVQSIIDALGTNAFRRFRIGIRPTAELKRKKAGDFALQHISKKDRAALTLVFEKIKAMAQYS